MSGWIYILHWCLYAVKTSILTSKCLLSCLMLVINGSFEVWETLFILHSMFVTAHALLDTDWLIYWSSYYGRMSSLVVWSHSASLWSLQVHDLLRGQRAGDKSKTTWAERCEIQLQVLFCSRPWPLTVPDVTGREEKISAFGRTQHHYSYLRRLDPAARLRLFLFFFCRRSLSRAFGSGSAHRLEQQLVRHWDAFTIFPQSFPLIIHTPSLCVCLHQRETFCAGFLWAECSHSSNQADLSPTQPPTTLSHCSSPRSGGCRHVLKEAASSSSLGNYTAGYRYFGTSK